VSAKYIQTHLLQQLKYLKYLLVWLKGGRWVGYLAFGWDAQKAFEMVFLEEKMIRTLQAQFESILAW